MHSMARYDHDNEAYAVKNKQFVLWHTLSVSRDLAIKKFLATQKGPISWEACRKEGYHIVKVAEITPG